MPLALVMTPVAIYGWHGGFDKEFDFDSNYILNRAENNSHVVRLCIVHSSIAQLATACGC